MILVFDVNADTKISADEQIQELNRKIKRLESDLKKERESNIALFSERKELMRQMETFATIAQSCRGNICVERWDNYGCNKCSLLVLRNSKTREAGTDDIGYMCRKRTSCQSPKNLRNRRAGTCAKYDRNKLRDASITTRVIPSIRPLLTVKDSSGVPKNFFQRDLLKISIGTRDGLRYFHKFDYEQHRDYYEHIGSKPTYEDQSGSLQ